MLDENKHNFDDKFLNTIDMLTVIKSIQITFTYIIFLKTGDSLIFAGEIRNWN